MSLIWWISCFHGWILPKHKLFTWKSFICWCVWVTMFWIDWGGCVWNTIRNILMAKTKVENRRKLLVFILRVHYWELPNITIISPGHLTDEVIIIESLSIYLFFTLLWEIKEINITDSLHINYEITR